MGTSTIDIQLLLELSCCMLSIILGLPECKIAGIKPFSTPNPEFRAVVITRTHESPEKGGRDGRNFSSHNADP